MDCVRVASKHGEGGAAQHTQAWQHMQQSCRTRVCSLCSSVPVLLAQNRILWRSGRVHHTERSLQVNGSHHIRITQLVIHQQQPESQELLPVAALAPTEPSGGAGITQLCSRTVARSPTRRSLPCDHLPAAANSVEDATPQLRSTPFDGLGSHTSLKGCMDDIAAAYLYIVRVATAA